MCSLFSTIMVLMILPMPLYGGEKIKALIVGDSSIIRNLAAIFDCEPVIHHDSVIVRSFQFTKISDQMKLIRLYFPRHYEKMRTYDLILLVATEYSLLTPKQDKWIYDAIREGAGGIQDGGMLSVIAPISTVWANSQAQRAFPMMPPRWIG